MPVARQLPAIRRRALSTVLAACYLLGLTVTVGHLACAHTHLHLPGHGQHDHAGHQPVGAIGDGGCCVHHQPDHDPATHTGLTVADQKPASPDLRWSTVVVAVFLPDDDGCRRRVAPQPATTVRTGAVAAPLSRAPPRFLSV